MNKLGLLSFSVSLAAIASGGVPAIAEEQSEPPQPLNPTPSLSEAGFSTQPIAPSRFNVSEDVNFNTAQSEESTEVTSLFVTPRFGGQFTTGPGTGYSSSFGSIYTFIPLTQTPGTDLTFAEGRLNIDTDGGRLGGNLVFGYRNYQPATDLVLGGYLAYDIRGTESTTFHQIGAGVEAMAGIWEARLNGYFPVGDTRSTVSESFIDRGSTFSNPTFAGNLLTLTQSTQTQRDRALEAALTGFDLEGGVKLMDWDGGDLKGFVGTYLYGGSGTSTFMGFRSRLVARPTENTNVGVSLQTDGNFGTNVVFSFGASFGGPSRDTPDEDKLLLDRLGSTVARNENITVDRQFESEVTTTTTEVTATNPNTGQPWFFRHVNLETGNSNGTFESPFRTVAEALNGISSDGNQIVYVQGNGTVPGFTIPVNVQVLSTGPVQSLNTQGGTVQLPLSGSGNVPAIVGITTLGTNSVLSGFTASEDIVLDGLSGNFAIRDVTLNITTAGVSGISGNNISGTLNLDISGTTINVNNADGNGIRLTNVTGTVAISAPSATANITTNNNQAGILFQNNPGTVNLSGLNVTANGGPILQATNNIGNISITDTTLTSNNSTGDGLILEGVTGTANIAANNGSQINNAAAAGVRLRDATGTVSLSGFQIANPGTSGVDAADMAGTLNFTGNTVNNSPQRGFFLANTTGTLNLNVLSNTINDSVADGVRVDLSGTGSATVIANVSNNTINRVTDAAGDAIDFEAIGNSNLTLTIDNNTIADSGNSGLELEVQDTATLNSTITNNRITNSGGDGILFLHNSSQNLTMNIIGNTIATSGTAANGISRTPGVPPFGNGGFGIGLLTLANGNLQTIIESNIVTNSQDAKIALAANPASINPPVSLAFAGTSRIDARVRLNQMTGTGAGAGAALPSGSFGALADSNSTVCLELQNNTADNSGVPAFAYLFANLAGTSTLQVENPAVNTGTTAPPVGTVTPVAAGTCILP